MSTSSNKSMFRPVGFVAFIAVSCALFLCFYWLAPVLIHHGIERVGTEINGAKVELDDVDVSLSPAGLTLYGLQVTDARQPMENAIEISSLNAALNLFELWGGKIIVDDLNIDTLRFGTPREYSGAIKKSVSASGESLVGDEESKEASLSNQLGKLTDTLPDANDLLSRHPLKTTQLASELDATFSAQKSKWEQISSQLPDEKQLEVYEQELKALVEGDIDSVEEFNQRKQKFDALKNKLEQDKARLVEAKDQLQNSKTLMQNAYKSLKKAPQDDLQSLIQTYSFDSAGGLNLSGLLFGEQFQSYAQTALYWYQRLAPLMAPSDDDTAAAVPLEVPRGTGRFIHFGPQRLTPDLMVRRAKANAMLTQGEVALEGRDLTHQQYISGKPSIITANATALNDTQELELLLSLDHRTQQSNDRFFLRIKGQDLNEVVLSKSDSLPLALSESRLDLDADVNLMSGQLTGTVNGQFSEARVSSSGDSVLAKEISSVLADIDAIAMRVELSGTLRQPGFAISSDLDGALNRAVLGRFKEKQKQWEAKLKAGLDKKLSTYVADNKKRLGYFSDQDALLEGNLDSINSMLDEKLDSFVEQQHKEVKEKVTDELQDKLKSFF